MKDFQISIFANVRVDDERRFQHLRDSFDSIKDISDDWLINVRGLLRKEVISFLRANLSGRMTLFEKLDEDKWFRNSAQMVEKAKHEYVMHWIEDHINLVSLDNYQHIVGEMSREAVDYLCYSGWFFGEYRKNFEVSGLQEHKYIDSILLTKELWKQQVKKGYNRYLISSMGIFRKNFLLKRLRAEFIKFPISFTNNLFRLMVILNKMGIKFHQRQTFDALNRVLPVKLTKFVVGPFDLEKSSYRWDVLPFKMGLSKFELCACIDDDIGSSGYQLIKRGLYPINFDLKVIHSHFGGQLSDERKESLENNDYYSITRHYLKVGEIFSEIVYPNINRIDVLPVMTIVNLQGELSVIVNEKKVLLKSGDLVTIFSNLRHEIMSENCVAEFLTIKPDYDKFYKI
jgi:mannose-6-phosphate isomerase-like protein (cupin superfamily)